MRLGSFEVACPNCAEPVVVSVTGQRTLGAVDGNLIVQLGAELAKGHECPVRPGPGQRASA